MLTGFEFYKIHNALKLHFTTEKYDVMKYSGKTSGNFSSFERRNDKMRFDSFAHKLIGKTKAGHFCVANFVHGSEQFVYSQYDDAYEVYLKWKKVRESITREFEKDVVYLNQLAASRASFDLFAKTKSGNFPPSMQVAMANKINVETLIILNKEHKDFFDTWSEICDNDPYVSNTLLKWKKYQPFVTYDADKIKLILKGAKF